MEAMRDAMRQATQLVRVRGPLAATRFIQRLLGTPHAPHHAPPITPEPSRAPQPSQFQNVPEVVAEVLDLGPHSPHIDELPSALPAETGQFLSKRFSSAVGDRNFKLYVPSCYAETPLPLIIMLHGCTQSPDDFAVGTRANRWAEARQCLVAYPEQIQRANAHRCWNWFRPADQHAGGGEPALIAGMTRQILSEYQIDARRVYVAGLSAGGAMAAIMGQTYPELFAAVGVHSGLPVGAAHDVSSALTLMKTGRSPLSPHALYLNATTQPPTAGARVAPMIVLQGDADRTVNPRNAARLVQDAVAARLRNDAALPLQQTEQSIDATENSHGYRRTRYSDANGISAIEQWEIHGAGHAWAGGDTAGSYTDARGPDAMRTMLEFFYQHTTSGAGTAADVISSVPT